MVDLLGKSQTLFGVLATIVVLCIFKGNNNFISEILKEIRERLKEKVHSLTVSVDFKPTKKRLAEKLKTESNPSKMKRFGDLSSKLSQLELRLTLMDMVSFYAMYDKKYERIEKGDEMLRGPLFTFLYIFIIFVFDEYLRSNMMPMKECMFTVVSFITLFSIVYWCFIWLNFIQRTLCNKEREVKSFSDKNRYMYALFFVLVCVLVYIATLFGSHILLSSDNIRLAKCLYWGGFLIPAILSGTYFIYTHPHTYNGYYLSLISHMLGIVMYSLFFAGICHLLIGWNPHFSALLIDDHSVELSKLCIFLFTFFNGLLLPFFCPLLCSYWIYRYQARAQVLKRENEANRILREINEELDSEKL